MSSNYQNVKNYWNFVSKALPFDKKDHWIDASGNPLNDSLFEEVALYIFDNKVESSKQNRILEVGCGTGRIINCLERISPKDQIYGIDFSDEQISTAKQVCSTPHLFSCDLFEFVKNHPNEVGDGFDIIYLHSVSQYFPSDEYFNDFLECSYQLLKKNGCLLIIDTPIDWYLEEMRSKPKITFNYLIKNKLKSLLPNSLLNNLRDFKKKYRSNQIQESFGNITLQVPSFNGYWAKPEVIEKFSEDKFSHYQMCFQTFRFKPVEYRKFRPIFRLMGKL